MIAWYVWPMIGVMAFVAGIIGAEICIRMASALIGEDNGILERE